MEFTDIIEKNEEGWNAIHYACWEGDYNSLSDLLEDIDDEDEEVEALNTTTDCCCGFTPMHCAVVSGSYLLVALILDKEGDYDFMDNDGRTPLMYACMNGYLDIVKLLMRRRFPGLQKKDYYGRTALDFAKLLKRTDNISYLTGCMFRESVESIPKTEDIFKKLIRFLQREDFDEYKKLLSSDQNYHLSIQKDDKGFDLLDYALDTKDEYTIELTSLAQRCANEVKEYEPNNLN